MKNSVFMEEMDAFTYREKLAKDAVVFIPVGALEQHGSHMAMCVDAALTKAMAGATAEAASRPIRTARSRVSCARPIQFRLSFPAAAAAAGFHLSGTILAVGYYDHLFGPRYLL